MLPYSDDLVYVPGDDKIENFLCGGCAALPENLVEAGSSCCQLVDSLKVRGWCGRELGALRAFMAKRNDGNLKKIPTGAYSMKK